MFLDTWKCLDIQKEIIIMKTISIISLDLILSLWYKVFRN